VGVGRPPPGVRRLGRDSGRVTDDSLMIPSPGGALAPRRGCTLAELVPVFLRQFRIVRGRSVATVRAYESDLTVFLTEFCPKARLTYPEQVRVQHLETFLGWLATVRGLQPSSVARYRHALLPDRPGGRHRPRGHRAVFD
jgi:hypothetical protein